MTSDPLDTSDAKLVRERTAIGALWLISWRFMTRLIGLCSTLILARVLVPADFGLLGMATAFSASVETFSSLGLQEALVRRQGEDRSIYNTAFTLQLSRSILTALFLICASPLAAAWFNEPRLIGVLFVLGAASVISGLENIGIVEFRRQLRFDMQFKLLLWTRLIQVIVTVGAALVLRSYWALLLGGVISKLARTLLTYAFHPYRPKLQLAGWRDLAGFSFWTWATGLASLIWDRCDPFVLGPKLGAAGLGFFLIAAETAYLPITEIVAPAADALFAGFAVSQKDGQSSMHLGPKVAITMVLCLLPLVLTISSASGDIVMVLLGAKWQETTPLVAIMVWACAFSPFSWFCSTVLVANGYVRQNFAANLIISIVKLTLLIVVVRLTTKLEWIAAAATLCVMLESLLFMLVLTRSASNALSAIRSGFFRMLLSTVVTAIALQTSGLGWTATMRPPLSAFAHGALIGALSLTVFGVSTLILWKAAGWADGPERWAVDLIGPRLSPAISFFRAIRMKRS